MEPNNLEMIKDLKTLVEKHGNFNIREKDFTLNMRLHTRDAFEVKGCPIGCVSSTRIYHILGGSLPFSDLTDEEISCVLDEINYVVNNTITRVLSSGGEYIVVLAKSSCEDSISVAQYARILKKDKDMIITKDYRFNVTDQTNIGYKLAVGSSEVSFYTLEEDLPYVDYWIGDLLPEGVLHDKR